MIRAMETKSQFRFNFSSATFFVICFFTITDSWSGNLSGSVESTRQKFNNQVESYEEQKRIKEELRRKRLSNQSVLPPVDLSSIDQVSRDDQKSSGTSGSANSNLVKSIRSNGSIAGNPSFLVTCSSGRDRIVMRKDGKWTDSLGASFSDRLWGLSIEEFAAKEVCA